MGEFVEAAATGVTLASGKGYPSRVAVQKTSKNYENHVKPSYNCIKFNDKAVKHETVKMQKISDAIATGCNWP